MNIIKRNGANESFDINKIKKAVAWACEGLPLEPLELESKISLILKEGISTDAIHNNMVHHAKTLISVQDPEWALVAGRLHIMKMWKERGHQKGYRDYRTHVKRMVKEAKYDFNIIANYDVHELTEAGSWIVEDRDLLYDFAGANLLDGRYLIDGELPQEMYMTIALLLAVPEGSEKMKYAKEYYDALSTLELSLATPILSNLRKPNGNLSSCFIMSANDDLDSIFDVVHGLARISKNGGGVGVNLSKVRGLGASIQRIKNASGGVIPWAVILNDTAIAVNQLGKRAGAVTVGLDTWHIDIEMFLEIQLENGDQRLRAYDIFPQVIVSDVFMNAVDNNLKWCLFDPHEVLDVTGHDLSELHGLAFAEAYAECVADSRLTLTKTVNARDLFKEIMKTQIESGMPYIFFKDLANEVNPNNHCGYIPQGNLCMESFSNVMADEETHTCNLVSLNLATLAKTDNLKEATKLAVRILDNTIELTKTPIKTATTHNDKYRTIGVGAMGLHDCLAYEGYSYENSAEEVDNLFELISYWTIEESIKLAGERGAYPAFKGSQWDTGTMIKRYYNQSNSRLSWHKLQEGIDKVGIRNSQLMAVAPNTSSSLLQGCTASVLPCFDIKFFDSAKKGANPVVVPFLRDSQWYYKAYRHMDPLKVTQVIASVSKWVDSGVSYELSFDLNKPEVNAKYAFDVIMDIWRTRKIKTIYYIRYVQKDANSVSKEEASCESCAG